MHGQKPKCHNAGAELASQGLTVPMQAISCKIQQTHFCGLHYLLLLIIKALQWPALKV